MVSTQLLNNPGTGFVLLNPSLLPIYMNNCAA
jgi:hypothetical protein